MSRSNARRQFALPTVVGATLLALTGCVSPTSGNTAAGVPASDELQCTIPSEFIANGGPGKDGIPALTNPVMVGPTDPAASYVRPDDHVIGLLIDGKSIAIPLNILWWHEIVNLTSGALRLSITHCPLTGSSLVFNRSAVDGAEFGVSGLLYMNNLMMYDRTVESSLWPQMSRGARCGTRRATQLPLYPSVEMTWQGWVSLHPATIVVSSATGYVRNYQLYPYGDYASPTNAQFLGPLPRLDPRRDPKERVLGIVRDDVGSIALPFDALRALGSVAAVSLNVGAFPVVVFWDASRESAAAFVPTTPSGALTFRVVAGAIVDDQSGSRWSVDGRALDGPLVGTQLTQVQDAFVAYWFAWAVFYPETRLWTG